ncbi:helix-turn-helix domain-containing protein [Actinomadura sp.]|uniref:helix-turn-helix domain-containing protein n=1 Tax=Actinomadura sp. TaxID=1989 RepID=UPI0037C81BBF
MPPTVSRWTGKEARALREAKRVSQVEFAAELGVSERMIVRWEKGNVTPRPINQQGLDTVLAACSPEVQARFAEMIPPSDENFLYVFKGAPLTRAAGRPHARLCAPGMRPVPSGPGAQPGRGRPSSQGT